MADYEQAYTFYSLLSSKNRLRFSSLTAHAEGSVAKH